MMVRKEMDPASYEGLIFATAARYCDIVDDELEDIQQILRVKVWKALAAFNVSRDRLGVESFVFSCVRNQVKDILKAQNRRNKARGGRQIFIQETMDEMSAAFELRYLVTDAEQVYFCVEDEPVTLPSTLTEQEVTVVRLLLMERTQTEIAQTMHITRDRVRQLRASVQEKMMDWRPDTADESELAVAA